MLETLYARNPVCQKLLLLLTHGPGPARAGKTPLGPKKNLARIFPGSSLKRLTSHPGHWAPSFCLGRGVFFLPR